MRNVGLALVIIGFLGAVLTFLLQMRALPGLHRVGDQVRGLSRPERRSVIGLVMHDTPTGAQQTDTARLVAQQMWAQRHLVWGPLSAIAMGAGLLLLITADDSGAAVLRILLSVSVALNGVAAAVQARERRASRRFLLSHRSPQQKRCGP